MLNPAKQLQDMVLNGGWRVLKPVPRPSSATGGHFSQCYLVESNDGTTAFLKALDYSEALESPDPARALQAMTDAYNFERDLLAKCRDRHMDRVVRALEDGSIRIDGAPAGGVVQYIIFELGDGDVRSHLARSQRIDFAWHLRSLHNIATGLRQLHIAGIAHQDVKPSNVLVFDKNTSKVADLGSAAYKGHKGPTDEFPCAGDYTYAPPELLYRFIDPDWNQRRFGCDVYLLGSMVIFFFTGFGTTSMLMNELQETLQWRNWDGSFEDVLPYLRDAFGRVVDQFAANLPAGELRDELKIAVCQLCDPDPRRRGHPANRRGMGSPFSLERYVSKFDLLARRAEMRVLRG